MLAATWARLSLRVEDRCASEAIDLRSESRRTSVYGSLFALAEWLVEHWWHLLYEPSPSMPVPSGRAAPAIMRDWIQRHNLLAARDGGALPDLTIARDGEEILLHWEPDHVCPTPTRIRFVGQDSKRVSVDDFKDAATSFVEAVLSRLGDRLETNEDVERVLEAWSAIRSADPSEEVLCRSLAVLGIDPYDPDEAAPSLIKDVERSIRDLPDDLRADLLEGSDPRSFSEDLDWVKRGHHGLRPGAGAFLTIKPLTSPTPHEDGYRAARQVRSELLAIPADEPIRDLPAVLEKRLGWAAGGSRRAEGTTNLEGLVGLDQARVPLLVVPEKRSERAERFRLARAAFFPVTGSLGTGARLLTGSATPLQRASRAFAAELLAPATALKKRVPPRPNDHCLEDLAEEFGVNPQLIGYQIQNHGLGYLPT